MRPAINLIISATALLMASCSGARHHNDTPEKPVVVVSIAPLSYFAEGIGGDKVDVEVMAPAGTDPETYEPSMASLGSASQASVIFTTGLLPFEEKIALTVKESSGGKTLNQALCDSLQLIMGTHGHDEADPHIWMSLRNARVMARTVCRALTRALPADSAYFRGRLAAMEHRLDSIDNATATALAPLRGCSFLIWHPSLSYFARDYGLQQVAIAAENKETSVDALRRRLDRAGSEKAVALFGQKELDSRQMSAISGATGLQPVYISPMSPDVEATLSAATSALVYSR